MKRRSLMAAMIAIPLLAAAAPARAPQLAALATIEPGRWALRDADAGSGRMVCIADPAAFLQLGHPGVHCPQIVLADGDGAVEVHYTCAGNGHGRTAITVETPRLIHVETQGIAHGAPFDFDYEGRKVGECHPRFR